MLWRRITAIMYHKKYNYMIFKKFIRKAVVF